MTAGGSRLSVYYHTHWDREWYLPFRLYQVRLAEVVDAILERLETGVLPCFMLDGQTVVLDDYLELRPQNKERLQRLIADERLTIGPWFVMPDEFLVGGESLIRNLVRGIRESHAWGCNSFTGYLPDTFGHSADMPTIFQHCGIDSSVVWRGIHPSKNLFRWQSPSGAQVITYHLTDGYFQMMLHDWTLNESEKKQALKSLIEKLEVVQITSGASLLPIGGDHLGPVTQAGHALLKNDYAEITETTPERFLSAYQTQDNLETVSGELVDNSGSFLLPGVYSSRMYLKQANRRLEHALTHQLEPLLALVHAVNPSMRYPAEELDLAWKTLILNHPHDSICGCSVDAVHRENEVRFDQVLQMADALKDRAMHTFVSTVGTESDWILAHTGDQAYTGIVPVTEDVSDVSVPTKLMQVERETAVLQDEYLYDSQRIPLSHLTKVRRTGWIWVDNLAPFSVSAIAKKDTKKPQDQVSAKQNKLENGVLSVSVENNGILTIQDQKTSTTYSELLVFSDSLEQGDSYNSASVPGTTPKGAQFKSCRVIAEGPLVGILELTHDLASLILTTQVRLNAGSDLVQFETHFVNQADNHKLQVGFETGKPITTVDAESHLSVIQRTYDPAYYEQDHMPVAAWKELKTNTGPVQRFFSANGNSFITEGLCEYEIRQSTVWITLMRGFSHLSKADTGVRGAQAGPPFETPEGQCLNRVFRCRYAWTPTPKESQDLYRLSDQFYGVVWGQSGSAQKAASKMSALVQWDNSAVVASACYWKSGQGLVLRLLNTSDKPVKVQLTPNFPAKNTQLLNFLEESQGGAGGDGIAIPAFGVQTVLLAI